MPPGGRDDRLPDAGSVLAVCAHPDDESFGLGAVLDRLVKGGARTAVLCLTHGEASTLGVQGADLGERRRGELAAAADVLGVERTVLLHHHDGRLGDAPLGQLADAVEAVATDVGAELLLVFDEGGITGHPDHVRATEAAMAAAGAGDLEVTAWAIPDRVAAALNAEYGTGFVGRAAGAIDLTIRVDRTAQRRAIACHASQSTDNPVLWRRLELLGEAEHLTYLKRSTTLQGVRRRTGGRSPAAGAERDFRA